jgi:drug/metabolite transporter (DMT)-like permease
VNPVIAVFLGWAVAGERLTTRMGWAAVVIVLGVIIITTRRTPALSPVAKEKEVETAAAAAPGREDRGPEP